MVLAVTLEWAIIGLIVVLVAVAAITGTSELRKK